MLRPRQQVDRDHGIAVVSFRRLAHAEDLELPRHLPTSRAAVVPTIASRNGLTPCAPSASRPAPAQLERISSCTSLTARGETTVPSEAGAFAEQAPGIVDQPLGEIHWAARPDAHRIQREAVHHMQQLEPGAVPDGKPRGPAHRVAGVLREIRRREHWIEGKAHGVRG